jgi:hypothetical protein
LKTSIEAESKKMHSNFELHLFNACVKSTNVPFREYAEGLMENWETDSAGAPKNKSEIVNRLITKWNNLCTAKPSKAGGKTPKVEEKAQYLALFTALMTSVKGLSEQVQSLQKSNGSNGSTGNQSNGYRSGNPGNDIAEWRKTKNLGDEVIKDGKQYYWCQKHQNGAGLYVTHHPLDHGNHPKDWEHTRRHKEATGNNTQSDQKSLQLSDSMKAALTSNGITNEAAESLITSLKDQSSTDFW